MARNKRLEQHQKSENTLRKILKQKSAIIYILLIATLLIGLFSLTSSVSSVQPMQSLKAEPLFNVDVVYAFVGKGPYEAPHSHFDEVLHYPKSQYPSAVYLNVTRASTAEIESCDAVIEVYLIQIISDKGPIEKYAWFEGTNYNPSFSDSELTSLTSSIYDLVDLSTINGVRGHFRFNWTDNKSILGGKVGSFGSYSSSPSGLGLWSAGKPNIISVTVHRIGRVTLNDDSISVRADTTSAKATVQLEKYKEGFLSNKIVTVDKLPQIDLFQPLD
jgi:hypothetical protein